MGIYFVRIVAVTFYRWVIIMYSCVALGAGEDALCPSGSSGPQHQYQTF